jgi:dsDNA-specific endonuclease/ATPase MutS2
MGRKKSRRPGNAPGRSPRRGLRRSIRYDAVTELDEDRGPARDPAAPPAVHLRLLKAEEALERLEFQLRAFAAKGQSEVLVVHGKGSNSPGGVSVLGPLVRSWCDDNPAVVRSWRIAPSSWGGEGAIVVVLNS